MAPSKQGKLICQTEQQEENLQQKYRLRTISNKTVGREFSDTQFVLRMIICFSIYILILPAG